MITKKDVKQFFKIFLSIIGVNTAWLFILPLDYTYARSSWFIVQYGPYVTIVLFILWIIRMALQEPKKQKVGSVE